MGLAKIAMDLAVPIAQPATVQEYYTMASVLVKSKSVEEHF